MKPIYLSNDFLNQTKISIVIVNKKGIILSVNPSCSISTQYTQKELVGQPFSMISSKEQTDQWEKWAKNILEHDGLWEGEASFKRKNGDFLPIKRTVFKMFEPVLNEDVYVYLSMELMDLSMKTLKVEDLATNDTVTGLPLRNFFMGLSERSLHRSKKINRTTAFMVIDLSRLTKISEALGYTKADLLFIESVKRIKKYIPEEAALTRLSGELLGLLIPNASDDKNLLRIIQKITDSFSYEPFIIEEKQIILPVSIGISLYPTDGDTAEILLKKANSARSRVKEEGNKAFQFYTNEVNGKLFEKIILESNIRRAIDYHEFVVYYQPKIDILTKQISGFEALVRWDHPDMGIVSPSEFIPMAEETGLIVKIGQFVLKESCRQLKAWHEQGYTSLTMAVNISAQQFLRPQFVEEIMEILKQKNLQPEHLDLELTESTLVSDIENTIHTMNQLKNSGINISIDDFGTGYSSLNYLAKFPLNSLKIDRSFIQNVTEHKVDRTIASMIIAMAHELNLKVIAEGVETTEQLAYLESVSCEEYQGYYFSPPVSSEQAGHLLVNQEKQT